MLSPPSPPTAFDFQCQAFFARLGATGFVIGGAEILSREPRQADVWLSRLRTRIEAIIHASVAAPQATIVAALLTGVRVRSVNGVRGHRPWVARPGRRERERDRRTKTTLQARR